MGATARVTRWQQPGSPAAGPASGVPPVMAGDADPTNGPHTEHEHPVNGPFPAKFVTRS
ncbi:hypothetical protein EASAB2608_04912 [Streptomyces sp. EAS-AB2608]|nr:hypothetical protein EASAB2608_04912 [Streptomyces sp. EAS-AB2608]CUW31191.1 hypothetical protein TUE45_05929 [Streptomyces reticuli]